MKRNIRKRTLFSFIAIILCLIQFICYGANYKLRQSKSVFNYSESTDKVRLQDDFYNAVNKEWIEKTKLNNGNVSYGTFEELCINTNENINNIILNIKENREYYDSDSEEIKLLNLYSNFMNKKVRDEKNAEPIKYYMNCIDEMRSVEDLREIIGQKDWAYFQSLINFGVGADYKDSTMNILYIGHSSLGLGNSLYYKNKEYTEIRKAYIDYVEKLHSLYGANKEEARKSAEDFYNLESKIAENIPTYQEDAEDNNRIEKCYNVYTLKELEKLAPNIEFTNLLCKFNIENAKKIIVEDPDNVKLVDSLITDENLDAMKNYFKTNILLNTDSLLSTKFREASSGIRRVLYGAGISDIDENSAVRFASCQLNGIVSKLYVEKYFDKESKDKVEELVYEIIDNFKKRLSNNSWMSNTTKKQALNKLEKMNVKVGYPKEWNDYANMDIKSYEEGGSLVANVINVYKEHIDRQFAKLNNKVDKDEWNMGAYVVNAYYNPLNNEIVFPAAILQPPFYDKNATKEKNLGGIGAVIGHELTHAFDNIGAQFDESGKLYNWWTTNDYVEFTNRSKKVIDYYSNIEVSEGEFVDGFLTAGENISDLGGIACVLDIAKSLDNPNLKDLFENYAVIWREVSTKELKDYLLKNDPHSPKKVRVNGVLSQFEEFYDTYNIKEGDKMYVPPEDRVGIW